MLRDWSRNPVLPSQPIECTTETKQVFVASVFPRFIQFIWCHLGFLLARCDIPLYSGWPLDYLGIIFYGTRQLQNAQHLILFLFFFSAEEGEEGEEDSPLSYDKLIMPGKPSAINVSRNIPNLGSVIKASQREGSLNP